MFWDVAAAILKTEKQKLDVMNNEVIDRLTLETRMPLSELGRVAYFRPDTLPMDFPVRAHRHPALHAARVRLHVHQRHPGVLAGSGPGHRLREAAQALVRRDAGTLINPMLVDEQIRGGVVQASAPRSTRNASTARTGSS